MNWTTISLKFTWSTSNYKHTYEKPWERDTKQVSFWGYCEYRLSIEAIDNPEQHMWRSHGCKLFWDLHMTGNKGCEGTTSFLVVKSEGSKFYGFSIFLMVSSCLIDLHTGFKTTIITGNSCLHFQSIVYSIVRWTSWISPCSTILKQRCHC